jgi:type I restriction enzyme, S subunit
MTRAGPDHRVGVVAYVHETQEQLMLSDKLYRLMPTDDFRPDFLALLLATSGPQKQISSFKVGMAQSQMNISQTDVKKLAVIKPSLEYQASAVAAVSSLAGC